MTPHNPQEETKKCTCKDGMSFLGRIALGDWHTKDCDLIAKEEKLMFESREEAKVYYYENINKYPPQSDTDYWESQFTQWLSEEKPIIKEELKDK